jgi:hypothetical protein
MTLSAVAGAVITIGANAVYHHIVDPPGIGTLTSLMDQDVAAAKAHGLAVLGRIYAPDAVVTDAACQTPKSAHTWTGLAEITARYRGLPRFLSLHHTNPRVLWQPDNSRAVTADVTADTSGVIKPSAGSQKRQFIAGHELWTFALSHGTWLITSFTYNLCLPGA